MIHWLDIKKHNPPEKKRYLVYDGKHISIGLWKTDYKYFDEWYNDPIDNATHWAELEDLNLPE